MQKGIKINLDYVKSKWIIEETEKYIKKDHLVEKELSTKKVVNGIVLPYKPSYGDKSLPNFGRGGFYPVNLPLLKNLFMMEILSSMVAHMNLNKSM